MKLSFIIRFSTYLQAIGIDRRKPRCADQAGRINFAGDYKVN